MILQRYYDLKEFVKPNKALIILGPRQVGKTTLVKNYLQNCPYKYRFETGDNLQTQHTLNTPDLKQLQEYIQGYELLVVDEAQKIANIGVCLKLLVDNVPNIRIIITGSSALELAGQVGEPLTGRKITLTLYPIAQLELINHYNFSELKAKLSEFLIYGSYPEIITAAYNNEKRRLISEITHSYLLKDILELDNIKNSKILVDLLRLLAFQIGSEVSLSELGKQLGINYKTVERYIDLLEKSFVIYTLSGFSQNLRKEIRKKNKYFFYDLGIRNALIANFNELNLRNDIGQLWENFLIIERIKKQSYHSIYANNYFWRTWSQAEIDWVEEREGQLFGYEFKWGKNHAKPPGLWRETYQNSQFQLINQTNYLEFIGP